MQHGGLHQSCRLETMKIKAVVFRKRFIQVVLILVVLFVLFTGLHLVIQALTRKTKNMVENYLNRLHGPHVRMLYDPGTPPAPVNTPNPDKVMVDLYKLYLTLIEVPTFMCAIQKRYGNVEDGGWEVCEQQPFTLTAPCLVHSWGINWEFSFDDAIGGKLGCQVHSFDPSMNVTSFMRSDNIIFHNYGIKGLGPSKNATWNMKTFNETLRDLNQEKSPIDYLKMDIEGDEWDVLTAMIDNENSFKHIRQVALELHLMPIISHQQLLHAVIILKRMRQLGLELFHSHQNPLGMGLNANFLLGKGKTCCHEVYYVNTKYEPPN